MESVLSFLAKKLFAPSYFLPISKTQPVDFWQTQPIYVVVIGEMPWYRGATAPRIDQFYPTTLTEL